MNEQSRAALIEHLKGSEYNGKTVEQAHEYFHTAGIAIFITTRPKQLTTAMFFAVLSPQSAGMVIDWPNLPLFIENIRDQNRTGIGMLIQGLALSGRVKPDEAKIATELLSLTEEVETQTAVDAPIVRVLYGIRDPGRPNAITLDEFTECFTEARG